MAVPMPKQDYEPETVDPEEVFEGIDTSYDRREEEAAGDDTIRLEDYRNTYLDPNNDEDDIYGKEPVFAHRDGHEEDIEDVQDYLEDEDLEEFEDLYADTLEEMVDDLDEASEDMEYDENYMAIDEDNGLVIEYEIDEEEDGGYDIEVRIHDMPEGLFGFTKLDGVVHVNKNLYKFEKESTIAHEMHHHLNPADDEFTVRHKNGDIDPGNLPSTRNIGDGYGVPNAPNVQKGLKKQYPVETNRYDKAQKVA